MSIKQNGGVFGRNPTFNDLTIEGDLILNGEIFTGLDFQGSWNASTNSPSLASSTGTNGEFYIVSVAGTTNLNGITNWGIGDWAIFNGTVWQRVEGGADGNFDALTANSLTINGADAVGIDDYILHNGDSNTKFGFSGNDAWKIRTGGVDAVTVDASQNVNIPAGNLTVADGSTTLARTNGAPLEVNRSNDGILAYFKAGGIVRGSISISGSTTAYNTSSDYRLKEDWQPMSGATDRLKELNPVNFAWKSDGSRVDGFLAHEAQEVVPESVTGSKDAMMTEEYEVSPATGDIYTPEVVAVEGVEAVEYVAPQDEVLDEEGNVVTEAVAEVMAVEAVEAVEGVAEVIHSANAERPETLEDGQLWRETTAQVMGEREVPDYQGIDQAKLVPLLVATIQELEARITALES